MGFYRSFARPLLFTLPAETAHHVAASALRLPLPWGVAAGDAPDLPTDLAGITLRSPVGVAAGFDKDATMVRALGRLGFGYVVVGTITREPRAGNPKPRIVRTPADRSITNSMGIPNDGVEAIARRLEGRHAGPGGPVVLASLADEAPDDVAAVHARLSPLVEGFELNVSSPNSPWRHSGRDNQTNLRETLAGLSRTRPLFVKLPPFDAAGRDESMALARIALDAGVDGLTVANTRPVDEPRLAKGSGGLSGSPLTGATPGMVADLAAAFPGVPLNACGGIATSEDARRCLQAGARTVQLYSAFIYDGPGIAARIAAGLAAAEPTGQDGEVRAPRA